MEQLAAGNTVIHRIHPMAKLLATFAYIVLVVSFDRYEILGLIPYVFYPSVLMALSETPFGILMKRLAITLPFVLFAGLSNILFDTGPATVAWGMTITFGMQSCVSILFKTCLTVMAVLLLVSTTTMRDLSCQLLRLHVPEIIVMLVTMTYRYLSILLAEAATMHTAYLLRAPEEKGIAMRRMGSFVGQLLLRSIDRAERVYLAMKCRGFHGTLGLAETRPATASDYFYFFGILLLAASFRTIDFVGFFGGLFVAGGPFAA